jgi:hypothetical protein
MQGDFKWGSFATRVFLTVTVGVLAALELAAIDPFIALLPEDQRFQFKLEIARKTFAQDLTTITKGDKSPATALDILASKEGQQVVQTIFDAAAKMLKKPS